MEERRIGEQDGEKRGELKKAQEDARNFYNLVVDIETRLICSKSAKSRKSWENNPSVCDRVNGRARGC